VLQSDFLEHLANRGILHSGPNGGQARRAEQNEQADLLNATRLTPNDFADELAAFYSCRRVQRAELVADRFAGADLSLRFLQEGHFFPYRDTQGALMLAIAAPVDKETVRAVEVALGKNVALAVATSEDLEAALSVTQNASAAISAPERVETNTAATSSDDLDELRDLARGAPVVRALDDLLRLAVDQRATDLHIEPFAGALQVRLRIDGLLKSVPATTINMAKGLLSRLKIMAGLNMT